MPEKAFCSAWWEGCILEKAKHSALVELRAFAKEESDDARLQEWIPWSRIRPKPPTGKPQKKLPKPPRCAPHCFASHPLPTSTPPHLPFPPPSPGDAIEAWWEDAWWEATLITTEPSGEWLSSFPPSLPLNSPPAGEAFPLPSSTAIYPKKRLKEGCLSLSEAKRLKRKSLSSEEREQANALPEAPPDASGENLPSTDCSPLRAASARLALGAVASAGCAISFRPPAPCKYSG
ncbi:MAG: hypothetical protein SGPRY_013113 [Prymnesium sp.]